MEPEREIGKVKASVRYNLLMNNERPTSRERLWGNSRHKEVYPNNFTPQAKYEPALSKSDVALIERNVSCCTAWMYVYVCSLSPSFKNYPSHH